METMPGNNESNVAHGSFNHAFDDIEWELPSCKWCSFSGLIFKVSATFPNEA